MTVGVCSPAASVSILYSWRRVCDGTENAHGLSSGWGAHATGLTSVCPFRYSSPKASKNPCGKAQLTGGRMRIGQCTPSGELDVFRDHWSRKGVKGASSRSVAHGSSPKTAGKRGDSGWRFGLRRQKSWVRIPPRPPQPGRSTEQVTQLPPRALSSDVHPLIAAADARLFRSFQRRELPAKPRATFRGPKPITG